MLINFKLLKHSVPLAKYPVPSIQYPVPNYLPICLLSFFLFFMGCGENYVYDEMHEIEKRAWNYEDTLDYTFEITDTTKIYNLLLEIDHTKDYAYQNCYFKIYTKFPSGERVDQLLSVDFADKIGQWHGDCGSNSCTILVDLQKGAFFNALGKHTITLEQYMRKNPLEGIHSLAIKLEDTGLKR